MSVLEFADTNIVVYTVGRHSAQRTQAMAILAESVTVSSQVINETVNVLARKQGVDLGIAHEVAENLLEICQVVAVDSQTIRKAISLVRRYQLSHWDSLIVAAALLSGCGTLYSQDMQHGHVFERQLKVVNPFI